MKSLPIPDAVRTAALTYQTNRDNQKEVPWDKLHDADAVFRALHESIPNITSLSASGSSFIADLEGGGTLLLEIHTPGPHPSREGLYLVEAEDLNACCVLVQAMQPRPANNAEALARRVPNTTRPFDFREFKRVLMDQGYQSEATVAKLWATRPKEDNDHFNEALLRLVLGMVPEENALELQ